MKKRLAKLMALLLLCAMLIGCNRYVLDSNNSMQLFTSYSTSATPIESQPVTLPIESQPVTFPPPVMSQAYRHITCKSTENLYLRLEEFPYGMGAKDILQNILFNQHLESLQNEIHRAQYIYWWGDETAQRTDVTESVDLIFHPKEYCDESTNSICTINGDETKLSVRVYYMPIGWSKGDFYLEGFEAVDEEQVVYKCVEGMTTTFYYFLNEHYVCRLTVDSMYMYKNSHVVEQFQKFCLSLGQM